MGTLNKQYKFSTLKYFCHSRKSCQINLTQMALTSADLKKRIADILKDADLETTSAKKVRTQLEEDTGSDLSSRKEEIGRLIQEVMDETADDESGDEEPEDEEDEPEEESEEEYAPKKNGSAKAKPKPKAK